MTPASQALTAVAVVSGVPLGAVVLLAASGRSLQRALPGLVTFGAGALAGAALFHLLPESYERHPAASWVAICALLGLVGSHLLERALHRWQGTAHGGDAGHGHGHEGDHAHEAHHSGDSDSAMVVLTLLGDAVHSLVDGALIAASFQAGAPTGLFVAAAIVTHELPRRIGTFALFLHYGTRPSRAVLANVATGLLAVGGALLTLSLGERMASAASVIMPFAAGSFLYLAGAVVLSQLRQRGAWELSGAQAVGGTLGLAFSALARLWA